MKARLSEGRNPKWDIDLEFGKKGEKLVLAFLRGMLDYLAEPGSLRVEVKTDRKYLDTGKVYIEYECKLKDGWQPSGIATSEADYWTFVIGETAFLGIPTAVVRACWQRAMDPTLRYQREEKSGSHPTRGVAIPLAHFVTWLYMELWHKARAA